MKFCLFTVLIILVGCNSPHPTHDIKNVSSQEKFIENKISTPLFLLTSYESVNAMKSTVNIYIEGDGRAWLSKKRPSLDPTPKNPVALKLATLDSAENVIYLARPCQYTKMVDGSVCEKKYWTSHRFAPEVIEAMDRALDNIKQRHNFRGFNLIGFSGGGNIATLLTARRDDVLSLRTVAGNLDHELQSKIHAVSLMPNSLNAKNVANQISDVPQIHFIGSDDTIVSEKIYESYKRAASQTECITPFIAEGVSHNEGWEAVWQALLSRVPNCS